MPSVSSLHLYPIKSCRAVDVKTFDFDQLGPVGDRRWMIVSDNSAGSFISQRTHPSLAQIEAKILDPSSIELSLLNRSSIRATVSRRPAISKTVEIWNHRVVALDAGNAVSDWLSQFIHEPVRLVGIGSQFQRFLPESISDQTGFADTYPLLILSQASLDDLNNRLDYPVEMSRFRPNIVVDACDPYEEDQWARIQIGDTILRAAGVCSRCIITTLDPTTGQGDGKEPLLTLSQYRKTSDGVIFGQNYTNESKTGRIEVGMKIQIL